MLSLVDSTTPAVAGPFPPQMPTPEEASRLQAQVAATSGRLGAAQLQLDALVARYEAGTTALENLNDEIAAAKAKHTALEGQLVAVQGSINQRASSNYRSGPTELLGILLGARSFRQLTTAMDLSKR